ncbi:hypothetical protein F4677DRAFT_175489 [Hypoxylon crocopeplum]|nr:hypothetical protein F4677DRAFT_175489 [Hypoxylon crocopeplum]
MRGQYVNLRCLGVLGNAAMLLSKKSWYVKYLVSLSRLTRFANPGWFNVPLWFPFSPLVPTFPYIPGEQISTMVWAFPWLFLLVSLGPDTFLCHLLSSKPCFPTLVALCQCKCKCKRILQALSSWLTDLPFAFCPSSLTSSSTLLQVQTSLVSEKKIITRNNSHL